MTSKFGPPAYLGSMIEADQSIYIMFTIQILYWNYLKKSTKVREILNQKRKADLGARDTTEIEILAPGERKNGKVAAKVALELVKEVLEVVIDEDDDDDDYDGFLEEEEDGDDEEDYKHNNKQKSKRKKSKSKPNTKEVPKNRAKGKIKPKSKAKKVKEDDKIALLESEEDENDVDNDDAEDEDEQEEADNYPQSKNYKAEGKGKEPEKPNPYRWTNSSQIFDKNKSSIYQRARARGSDRESIRQLEIQRHRKRRERESSSKTSKKSISESPGDDDWTDTDASSIAPSKRSGSTSSRLSSLFGSRNRSLTPEPTSHLMSPISPLTRPSISSKAGETTFGVSVIKASPLQEIVSADSLPANPEPKDAILTPPPAVHQRPASPLTKAAEPCPEGMKKVIFMSRGKRSSVKLVPSDGKATDDVEIILTR
ncbi:hypothetical protein H4I96_09382 [Botrytis cinerea]